MRAPGHLPGLQRSRNHFSFYLPLKHTLGTTQCSHVPFTESGTLNTQGSNENKSYSKAGIAILAKTLPLTRTNRTDLQLVDPVPRASHPRKAVRAEGTEACLEHHGLHGIPAPNAWKMLLVLSSSDSQRWSQVPKRANSQLSS